MSTAPLPKTEPFTRIFIMPKRVDKRDDGTLRGWMLSRIDADEVLIKKLQSHRTPLLDTINRIFSFFGGELFNVILLPCLFWWAPLQFACLYAFMFGSTFVFGNYVKNWFALPRPSSVWSSTERLVSDWGFPSTHTIGSCLLPPFVAFYITGEAYPFMPFACKVCTYVLAACWGAGVVFSRVYLGAHSLLDVGGGMACALVLAGFWYLAHEPILEMVVQESFPMLAFTAPLWFVIVHPISTPVTPLTGDSAMLCGMSSGITLGVWLRERIQLYDWTHAPWTRRDAVGIIGVGIVKFLIGTIAMLIVRAVAKKVVRIAAVYVNSKLLPLISMTTVPSTTPTVSATTTTTTSSSSTVDTASVVEERTGLRQRSTGVKCEEPSATERTSVLDEHSAEEDFFLNVDLPVKYATYLALGFVGTVGAPLLFYYAGLPL